MSQGEKGTPEEPTTISVEPTSPAKILLDLSYIRPDQAKHHLGALQEKERAGARPSSSKYPRLADYTRPTLAGGMVRVDGTYGSPVSSKLVHPSLAYS